MPKGKTKIDFGEGECGYRFCDRPGKKFPKKKDKQAYCSDKHRVAEWNLQHPRTKEKRDALAQVPMPFPEVVFIGPASGITPNPAAMIPPPGKQAPNLGSFVKISEDDKGLSIWQDATPKKKWHYRKIETCETLQDTLRLLLKLNPTSKEINDATGSGRGGSDISELRHNGFEIDCIKVGESSRGKTVNRFALTEQGKEKAVKFFQDRKISVV
jgi:hypothetical protein